MEAAWKAFWPSIGRLAIDEVASCRNGAGLNVVGAGVGNGSLLKRGKEMKIAGWVMTGLLALFMLGASVAPKLMGSELALGPLEVVGWPAKYLLLIGIIELVATVLFVIPRTSLLGAVLLTGLLSAALAANLRVDNPLWSHTLFSLYLGVFAWVALWLREPKIRAVFPLT
jgi:uncharacterized membrane protein YphA (DoxX/SURF4 family)